MTLLDRPDTPADDDGFAALAAAVTEARQDRTAEVPDVDLAGVSVPGLDVDADETPLREVLATWGSAPLATLFALNAVDELDRVALVVLAPNLRDAFEI